MYPSNLAMYAETKDFFDSLSKQISALHDKSSREIDIQEHCDTIYALREISSLLDHLRKESDKLKHICEVIACVLGVEVSQTKIVTEYCTGELHAKPRYKMPSSRSEEYLELLHQVPEDLLRIHYPDFQKYCRMLAENGLPAPMIEGRQLELDTEFSVPVRKKKGLGE